MSETLLEVKGLKIEATAYPPGEPPRNITIVEGVSFKVEKGKVLGLIGESGAGKSTIGLSSMAYGRGGVRITGGEVFVNGRDIMKAGPAGLRALRGREVTYVAQSAAAAFNPAKKLMEQVIETTLHHGLMSKADAEARAVSLFARLGLPKPETIGNRYPHQVSGGQLQRVMTAMALCPKPDLVVFDEPTTALDVTTQIEVLAAIKEALPTRAWLPFTSPMIWPLWRRWLTISWCCRVARWWNMAPQTISSTPPARPIQRLWFRCGLLTTRKNPGAPRCCRSKGSRHATVAPRLMC